MNYELGGPVPTHRLAVRNFLGGPNLTPADLTMVLLMREDDASSSGPMPTFAVSEVAHVVAALDDVGVRSVKVFAGSRIRDARASQAASPTGLMARSIRAVKKARPGMAVLTETCVCSHNDSGECWLADTLGRADLDETTEVLAAQAVMQVEVGADIVGPASMIPGSVRAVREALNAAGHHDASIMPHLIFESSLYEGYRTTMRATPRSGARAFQINPRQPEQAVHIALDMVEEGADMLLT